VGMTLPPDAREALVYRQGRGNLVARNLPLIFGYGLIGGGTVAFTAVMILDFQRDPSTPLAYFLLPVIVWGAFLEALLVSGAELSRSRFVVWANAFAPPFRRSRLFAPRLAAVIPFETAQRVVPGIRVVAGKERTYSVSVELRGGERLLVRESDVGTTGIRALLSAWSEWNNRLEAPSVVASAPSTPPLWVGREWREELAIGLGLLAILVVAALLIALAGNNNIAGRVAFAALFVSGFAFAVGWILSARSRMRRIIKMREDRPRLESNGQRR